MLSIEQSRLFFSRRSFLSNLFFPNAGIDRSLDAWYPVWPWHAAFFFQLLPGMTRSKRPAWGGRCKKAALSEFLVGLPTSLAESEARVHHGGVGQAGELPNSIREAKRCVDQSVPGYPWAWFKGLKGQYTSP